MERIKLLPVAFRKYGYQYEQIALSRKGAIYAQKDENGTVAYEVIRTRKIRLTFGRFGHDLDLIEGYTHKEIYPSSSDWGERGWTFMSIGQAKNKLNELSQVQR